MPIVKCSNAKCGKEIFRQESQLKRAKHGPVCSTDCKYTAMRDREDNYERVEKELQFVRDYFMEIGPEGCGKKFGIGPASFLKIMAELRKVYPDLPHRGRKRVEGKERVTTMWGSEYKQRVIGGKWVTIERLTPYVSKAKHKPAPKPTPPRPVKKVNKGTSERPLAIGRLRGTEKIYIAEHHREPGKLVRIDHKTFVIKRKAS